MFRRNTRHLQIPLISHVDELPEPLRKRLQTSWAGTFYQEFFCRLDEKPFARLYADLPSRPNIPVNVLVALEFLKAANGWTDEEMYNEFCYNVQVRYAVGYRQLGEGYFDVRTLYYFRERLAQHMQETGENLLEQAFAQVTGEQLRAFALKAGKQRMDSTLLASNIRQMGRVQLLVAVLQRVHQMLTEADRQRYAERFAPYLNGHPGQYAYRLKQEELGEHLQRIGEEMRRLLDELADRYGQEAGYAVLARVFVEHFRLEQEKLQVKNHAELSASGLQSPDDLEASYREKRGKGYRGYVVNVAETCEEDNPVQVITVVQVAPNTTDDSVLLSQALPDLKMRTGVEVLYTDGGYGGEAADEAARAHGVTLIQTAIRGRSPARGGLRLSDFAFEGEALEAGMGVTCPNGQIALVNLSQRGKAYQADFRLEACAICPLQERCPSQSVRRERVRRLRFTAKEWQRAKRIRRSAEHQGKARNLRAAVEATIGSLKRPFPAGKLPVRGRFRATCMVIGVAAVINLRRLHRYLQAKIAGEQAEPGERSGQNRLQEQAVEAFFSLLHPVQRFFDALGLCRCLIFGW